MSMPSTDIRVFVQWKEQTVFAGEDVECQITFKNVAATPAPAKASSHPPSGNGYLTRGERQKRGPTTQTRARPTSNPRSRSHRATLSLNDPLDSVLSPLRSDSWTGGPHKVPADTNLHRRSVSIISIGASGATNHDAGGSHGGFMERSSRTSRGHGRSASLQIVPRRHGINGSPAPAPLNRRSSTQPSPLFAPSFSPDDTGSSLLTRQPQRNTGSATAPSTPGSGHQATARSGLSPSPQNFRFPAESSTDSSQVTLQVADNAQDNSSRLLPLRPKDDIPVISEQAAAVTKVLSPSSIGGTPRSSGEFYSPSNNSTETLASQYLPQHPGRTTPLGVHTRKSSNMVVNNQQRLSPEVLMMGSAQVSGAFTLDASLISQTPFEEVKRKGVVGGQGGGVIGVDISKRGSGLLRGLGWGNIAESIGGLLGSGELSSIKDMRGIASSRSIPLLSTPQSILFVDLRLGPGESKTYRYSFKLPRGLPPSHRGKAIKISYKLVIGTQRPGGAKEQQVRSVEIPFRLLGSVNNHGELLGHDLMSPYIILRDQAIVQAINGPASSTSDSATQVTGSEKPKKAESTLDDFLTYVDGLLTRPPQNSSLGLLSPTEAPRLRRKSSVEEPSTAKEAIHMAIQHSNIATDAQQSASKFEIARSGKRVAVVMLARPAYRLGETITAAIDFLGAEIPCYAIHATLESSEKVDKALALRSEASILRLTRKVHVAHSESTLFARRVVFSPTIPVTATQEFITSGINLEWRIRIEFVTPRLLTRDQNVTGVYPDLLEEVSGDDRGVMLAAAESIECESFEIAVPLRVYGAMAANTEKDDLSSDGLVV